MGYHFKGIYCPLCDHHFTALMHRNVYTRDGKDYHLVVCPMCGIEMYVGDTDVVLDGVELKSLVLE